MHYHNSTDKQTFLLFIILVWIIGKNLHLVHCQLQNFVFTFFFGWLCHFQRWVFSGKLWLKRSFIPSTFSLTSASAAKMWKQASGGGLSLSWLQRMKGFEFNQFPVFHLLFDLVFQDFSSLTLIPQFSCFSVSEDFVSIISSVTTSAALPPSFAVLEALQYSLLLCAKVLFRLFLPKRPKSNLSRSCTVPNHFDRT